MLGCDIDIGRSDMSDSGRGIMTGSGCGILGISAGWSNQPVSCE